jgi:hypothetical protein
VAGFAIERNELPTAQRREAAVAVQHGWRRTFVDVRGFDRDVNVPAFSIDPATISDRDAGAVVLAASLVPGGLAKAPNYPNARTFGAALLTPPDANFTARGLSAFANQIVGRRFSVFADEQFVRTRSFLFDCHDSQRRVGVNYIHPNGVFARVSTRVLAQRFSNTIVTGLPSTTTTLVDASLKYEFAAKRGLLTATVDNLFGQDINTVVESLSLGSPQPQRRLLVTLRWRM